MQERLNGLRHIHYLMVFKRCMKNDDLKPRGRKQCVYPLCLSDAMRNAPGTKHLEGMEGNNPPTQVGQTQ